MAAGRQVDVWLVDVAGLALDYLVEEGGWWLCRASIPADRLRLVESWQADEPFGDLRPVPLPRRRR